MTPTLYGRWQTRLFLLATIGVLVSLPFVLGVWGVPASSVYLWIVFYVGLFGVAWDLLYNALQKFMWDHDWPGVFQFFAAIAEGAILILLIKTIGLPYIASVDVPLTLFAWHYASVSIAAYLASWVIMRLLFPQWRFRGGQWLGRW